jgi:hypothetical protein
VGGGSVGDVSDVLFHESVGSRAFEIRNQKIAFHLQDFLLAEGTYELSQADPAVEKERMRGTHPAVTHEKTSPTTVFTVTFFLMSSRAFVRRGVMPSSNQRVSVTPETFNRRKYYQVSQNVYTLWRARRWRRRYRVLANVIQARDHPLRLEWSEQNLVCAAVEEYGFPARCFVISLEKDKGNLKSARTPRTTQ